MIISFDDMKSFVRHLESEIRWAEEGVERCIGRKDLPSYLNGTMLRNALIDMYHLGEGSRDCCPYHASVDIARRRMEYKN